MIEEKEVQIIGHYGVIKCWASKPRPAAQQGMATIGFKVEQQPEDWFNTAVTSEDTLVKLKERFPVGTRIQFDTYQVDNGRREVLIKSIQKQEVVDPNKPLDNSDEQIPSKKTEDQEDKPKDDAPTAPAKKETQPVKDMESVASFQNREADKQWKRNRAILRQVLLKEASALVRLQLEHEYQADKPEIIKTKIEEAAEQIIEVVERMEKKFDKVFPDEQNPQGKGNTGGLR